MDKNTECGLCQKIVNAMEFLQEEVLPKRANILVVIFSLFFKNVFLCVSVHASLL